MTSYTKAAVLLLAVLAVGSIASATDHSGPIVANETWTAAQNPHRLLDTVIVSNGATLTIEAGVVIASGDLTSTDPGGSLIVTRGSKLKVMGTADAPVIFTAADDVATWNGFAAAGGAVDANGDATALPAAASFYAANSKSGSWLETCNEWGSIAILGNGYIAATIKDGGTTVRDFRDGNGAPLTQCTKAFDDVDRNQMEGLTAAFPGDPNILFGGGDDDDDSGEIHYLSVRYAGKVIGLGNELNGMSLGGVGRETEIDHVEIMNNVDDGIEIWGGTVEFEYISIWNIGDDSFDVDCGWRGTAQYGLIVQGYSIDAGQGSGVGDNAIEMDGAEDSDSQPWTTAALYNITVVGQNEVPGSGKCSDYGVALRNECAVQVRKSLFIDIAKDLVNNDETDSGSSSPGNDQCAPTGAANYGYGNGPLWSTIMLTWNQIWNTPFDAAYDTAATNGTLRAGLNNGGRCKAQLMIDYQAQKDGNLCEFSDNGYFNCTVPNGDVTVAKVGFDLTSVNELCSAMPLTTLARGALVTKGGHFMARVTDLDPRPSAAVTGWQSTTAPPAGSNFEPTGYRGAFGPNTNWLLGWTASDAFGMHAGQSNPASTAIAAADLTQVTTKVTIKNSVNGATYKVEKSSDGSTWTYVGRVVGNGGDVSVSDTDDFDTVNTYRATID